MGDDRPFVCSAPGCGQRFTNEDHLAVHKHKHEMTLRFGPARTDSVIIADQTPTPTRFLKNCEEVGLFNELAGSFEHEFKKGGEDEEDKKSAGPLDMSLPSTPDIKIKEEEPVDVDSSPPDSPQSLTESKVPQKPQVSSTPTPTIVRPGSLPLHLNYDPLHPTLPSPTSVITQAPPSSRQLCSPSSSVPLMMHIGNGQPIPFLPGPHVQMPSVISLARPISMVPNIPGIPGPPVISGGGHISPSGHSIHSEAKMRLKASLTHQTPSSLNGGMAMVASRPEQSQILVQHPDAPSPAQPQVSPAQPTPSTGGRRRRATDEDPDERRQRFLERNRAAASRCRQKRKVWVCSLEKKAEELTSQNVHLSNEVTLLRNEVAQLKQLLLAHKDCPVTALQKKNPVYRVLVCSRSACSHQAGAESQENFPEGALSYQDPQIDDSHITQSIPDEKTAMNVLLRTILHNRPARSSFHFQPQRFGRDEHSSILGDSRIHSRGWDSMTPQFWSMAVPQRFGRKK